MAKKTKKITEEIDTTEDTIDSILTGDINLVELSQTWEDNDTGIETQLSFDMLFSKLIKEQILGNNRGEYNSITYKPRDFFKALLNKVKFLIQKLAFEGDEKDADRIKKNYSQILIQCVTLIESKYGFICDLDIDKEDIKSESMENYCYALYRFFVIERTLYLSSYCKSFIKANRRDLAKALKDKIKTSGEKDINLIRARSTFVNLEDSIIIAYLKDIITSILEQEIYFGDFIEEIIKNDKGFVAGVTAKLIDNENKTTFNLLAKEILGDENIFNNLYLDVRQDLIMAFEKKEDQE